MITVYKSVSLPGVAGQVQWEIEPRGTGRVRLRAVVAQLQVDVRDQITVSLARTGQNKLMSSTGEITAGVNCVVAFGIGLTDGEHLTMTQTAGTPIFSQAGLHDIWLSDDYVCTINALTANQTVATLGVWLDYEN